MSWAAVAAALSGGKTGAEGCSCTSCAALKAENARLRATIKRQQATIAQAQAVTERAVTAGRIGVATNPTKILYGHFDGWITLGKEKQRRRR